MGKERPSGMLGAGKYAKPIRLRTRITIIVIRLMKSMTLQQRDDDADMLLNSWYYKCDDKRDNIDVDGVYGDEDTIIIMKIGMAMVTMAMRMMIQMMLVMSMK